MNIDEIYNSINLNKTVEALTVFSEKLILGVKNTIESLKLSSIGAYVETLGCPIEFTEVQITLLKAFLFVFLVNLILIAVYWRKYGTTITDRFIRPSTVKEIEELKLSVAKLKLPKEHSPRI